MLSRRRRVYGVFGSEPRPNNSAFQKAGEADRCFLLYRRRRSAGQGLTHRDRSPPAKSRKGPFKGGDFGLLMRVEHAPRFFLVYAHAPRQF